MIINANSITNEYMNVHSLSKMPIYFPLFQRGFSWSPAQAKKILDDIDALLHDSSPDEKHFYLLDFIGFRENGLFKLAEGQQRIVSLTILTKCLIDIAAENGIETTIENFDLQYEDALCQMKWEQFKAGKIVSPFKKVYIELKKYIEERKDRIPEIEKILINNIYVYVKMTSNADDAFDIFEQINTGGKPLTKDEIMTTIIKQYSNKYGIELEIEKKSNNALKEMLTSYAKYVDRQTGAFNSLAIMSFLNTHVVKTRTDFEKFNKYIKVSNKANELEVMCIAKYLNRSQLIDMIYAYGSNGKNLRTARNTVEQVFMPLFLLCSIFTLTGQNPGGRTKRFLDDVVQMVREKKSDAEIQKFILDFVDTNKDICTVTLDQFADALRGKTRQKVLEALLLMDVIRVNTSGMFIAERINLEHIYPKKPSLDWCAHGWPMNKEEQEQFIHDIGNYLLLCEIVNKKIKNKYISDKRDEYNKIIPLDNILRTPLNTVDFDEFEKSKDYIAKRRKMIAEQIRDNFPCAKAFIK